MGINAYWEHQTVTLPAPPEGCKWYVMIDTNRVDSVVMDMVEVSGNVISIPPRTVMVFESMLIEE